MKAGGSVYSRNEVYRFVQFIDLAFFRFQLIFRLIGKGAEFTFLGIDALKVVYPTYLKTPSLLAQKLLITLFHYPIKLCLFFPENDLNNTPALMA